MPVSGMKPCERLLTDCLNVGKNTLEKILLKQRMPVVLENSSETESKAICDFKACLGT